MSRLTFQHGERREDIKVELDGQDITKNVSHLNFDIDASDQIGQVTLTCHVFNTTLIDAEGVTAGVDDDTRALLVALGWTPPEEKS